MQPLELASSIVHKFHMLQMSELISMKISAPALLVFCGTKHSYSVSALHIWLLQALSVFAIVIIYSMLKDFVYQIALSSLML